MSSQQEIKAAFERSAKALSLKPSVGLGTGTSKTRIVNGLSCKVTEGEYELAVDMPPGIGGNASAPKPGVYGRAALGSCLAIGYMLYASKMDIVIDELEVEIQTDYNDAALLGVGNVRPGYQEVRYMVTITSDAATEDLTRMLDEADQHSPYLNIFRREQKCVRTVHILSAKRS